MASLSMRRFGLNALLLVVVLGLAGLVGWQLQQKEQQAVPQRLLDLTLADVTSVLVVRKTDSPVETI